MPEGEKNYLVRTLFNYNKADNYNNNKSTNSLTY